jgi:DNA-binding response OmpR family regulator
LRPFRVIVLDHEQQVKNLCTECFSTEQLVLERAGSATEVDALLQKGPADLVLVEPHLPDGSGLTTAKTIARLRPQTQIVVITSQPTLEHAMEAVRIGAVDYLVKPLAAADLGRCIRRAMVRSEARRRAHNRIRRLQKTCTKLNQAREEVTQQVDILCNDLVNAYQELATQMQQVMQASELNAMLKEELDLEQLIRKVLEFLLEKAGPTNAVIFLPASTSEYTLGGYVNYDREGGPSDFLPQHLTDILAPRVAEQDSVLHITENETIESWLGEDWNYLADNHLLAAPCKHEGENLASIILFRKQDQPFDRGVVDTIATLAPTLAGYLARIIRVHQRSQGMSDEQV